MKRFWAGVLLVFSLVIIGAGTPKSKRIVYADIAGDLFHAGHISFLKKARAFGDHLIVGVISDEHVESYKRRPVLTVKERAEAVRGCKYVDEVIEGVSPICTKEWIEEKGIDVVVHGDDFNPEDPLTELQYGVPMKAGIFKTVPYTKGISTSNIINRIISRYQEGDSFKKAK